VDRPPHLWIRPEDARFALVLAHGAGAGMRHPFLQQTAERLAEVAVATFRYEFPYMQRGVRGRPDPPAVLTAAVREAVERARALAEDLPLLAGGKSLGGRMTSTAAAESPLPGVRGLVFFGFPLHPPGRPSTQRAQHLARVAVPMLFLQGTRDTLAEPSLVRSVCDDLGERAVLHVVPDADHSFHVPKSSRRTDADVLDDLARVVADWAARIS
jgi:predicted alpha/beta-hydrolase family hydrolase